MGVLCRTKYKYNPRHKAIYNSAIPYLMALIMISFEFSEDPENEQINFWPKHNPIALDKIMINGWNKWAIDLGRKKGQQDKNIANKPTKFEA